VEELERNGEGALVELAFRVDDIDAVAPAVLADGGRLEDVTSAPIDVRHPALRVTLALGQPGQFADLGLHHRLSEHPDALAQEVDVALGALRTVSSTAILFSATAASLRVVGS
jgi:hypothetical protein